MTVCASAVAGLGGAFAIWTSPSATRFGLSVAGILALIGAAALLILGVYLWVVITETVRPRLRLGRPAVAMSLSHREAAMVGEKRFRHHPVRYWGALTFSNRFMLGFLILDRPTHELLRDRDAAQREREAVEAEGQQPGPKGSPVSGSPTDRRG